MNVLEELERFPLEWRPLNDLDVLYLGNIPVGRVAPAGTRGPEPGYIFNLANVSWVRLKRNEDPRLRLKLALGSWLMAAGLI